MRAAIARHLLADTELSLAHIAAALDFSEAAAFTHAFRRWSGGVPPSVWRAQRSVQRGGGDARVLSGTGKAASTVSRRSLAIEKRAVGGTTTPF